MYHVNRSLNSTNSVDLCIISFQRNRDIPIKTIYSTTASHKTARLIWSHATEIIYTAIEKVSNFNIHKIKIKKTEERRSLSSRLIWLKKKRNCIQLFKSISYRNTIDRFLLISRTSYTQFWHNSYGSIHPKNTGNKKIKRPLVTR